MEVMGISISGNPGHIFFHILRETVPCSLLTPLLICDSRRASTVMPKGSF
jgi:hypothetical protein